MVKLKRKMPSMIIACALAMVMLFSSAVSAFAGTASVGSVAEDVNGGVIIGQDVDQSKQTEYSYDIEVGDTAITENCDVYATVPETDIVVTVPKVIILDGKSAASNVGVYTVKVQGDISADTVINVEPQDEMDDRDGVNFEMSSPGKKNIPADVEQEKIAFTYADGVRANAAASTTGTVKAYGITAGQWNGDFVFNINASTENNSQPDIDKPNETDESSLIQSWDYELNDEENTILLKKYTGTDPSVNVPATFTVNEKTYNSVLNADYQSQKSAFTDNTLITSVYIEDGVAATQMSYMFRNCQNLLWVNQYPEYDGDWWISCFNSCFSLLSAPQIPNDIDKIRITSFFSGCSRLLGNYSMPDSVHSSYNTSVFKDCVNINKSTNAVWFGDSITAGTVTEGVSFVNYLRDDLADTGISNYAVGGRTLSYGFDQTENNKKASIISDVEKFNVHEDVDYVFISAGSNDFAHQSSRHPFGTYRYADIGSADDTSPATVSGAIYNISTLAREKFPNATIIFTTPLAREKYDDASRPAEDGTNRTVLLKDFADGIKAACSSNGVSCIDAYAESGFNPLREENGGHTTDSTHPSLAGQEFLANYYCDKLVAEYGFTKAE